MLSKFNLILTLSVITFSCAKKEESIKTVEPNSAVNLAGRWTRGCAVSKLDASSNPTEWVTNEFIVSGSSASETVISYSSSDCAAANKKIEKKMVANLTAKSASTVNGYNYIDFTILQTLITPHQASITSSYNTGTFVSPCGSAVGYCGKTNWTTGTPMDITGFNHCQSNCIESAAGATKYSIFSLGYYSGGALMQLNTYPVNALLFGGSNSIDKGPISNAETASAPTFVNGSPPYTGP